MEMKHMLIESNKRWPTIPKRGLYTKFLRPVSFLLLSVLA